MPDPIPNQTPENAQEFSVNEVSRDQQSQKVIRFLKKLKADEIFSNEENKQRFIKNLDFESFRNFLYSANAVLRGIPVRQRAADGEKVYLKGFVELDYPPNQEDKHELLVEVFNNAKEMNEQGRDLKDIALLTGASLNALHLFNDANGRTSRLTYSLLTHNFQGSEEDTVYLTSVLGDYGREVIDVNPSILFINEIDPLIEDEAKESVEPKPVWQRSWIGDKKIRQLLRERNIADDDVEFMITHCRSERFGFLALEKYLFSQGILANYVESFDKDHHNNGRLDINFDQAIKDLSPQDIQGIKAEYWRFRRHRVEILIDMISNPEKYPSKKVEGKTAKEYFEDKIAERAEASTDIK